MLGQKRGKGSYFNANLPHNSNYLTVLLTYWNLRYKYRQLGDILDQHIKQEELQERRRPKLGYGHSFRSQSQTPNTLSRSRSAASTIRNRTPLPVRSYSRISSCYRSYRKSSPDRFLRTPTPFQQSVTDRIPDRAKSRRSPPVNDQSEDINLDDNDTAYLTNEPVRSFSALERISATRMLSPSTQLPESGMIRSKTSIGVYSNLASHNRQNGEARKPKTEMLPIVKSGEQFKLSQAVKDSNTEQIKAIFEDNPDISLRYLDANDCTVLHHCFDMEKKSVDMEVFQLLLDKKPPLDDYGKTTVPVLHLAARFGPSYCVYLLLKHGADVNVQHKGTYRTALHEAVVTGYRQVVQILLYYGADDNAREREGRTAADLCRENVFPRREFNAIQETVADKRMDIQEITQQTTTSLPNTRTSISLLTTQTNNVPVMITRDVYVSGKTDITLLGHEDIISDVYTCQLLQTDCNVFVTLWLPLFEKSCSSMETVLVKTLSGQQIENCKTDTDKENMVVVFDTYIKGHETFLAVSKPIIEQWQIGKTNTVLGSMVDSGVRINVNKSTFHSNAVVTLQVIELPDDIVIKEGDILASTPFYKICVDVKPVHNITIELPKPGHLGEDGDTVILVKLDDYWRAVKTKPDEKRQTVSLEENSFPITACVARVKTGSSTDTMVAEINDTLTQVLNMTYSVCVLCHTQRIANTRSFNVVVECCRNKESDARRRYWKGHGYDEQDGKDPGFCVDIASKQNFKLVFYESTITRKNPRVIDLEFHRKRSNIARFVVELKGKSIQFINGRLYVYQTPSDTKFDISSQHLTFIDVNLLINQAATVLSDASGNTVNQESQVNVRPKSIKSGQQSRASTSSKGSRASPKKIHVDVKEVETDSLKRLQNSLAQAMQNVDESLLPEKPDEPEEEEIQHQNEQQQQQQKQPKMHDNGKDFLDDQTIYLIIDELSDDWYKVFVLMGMDFAVIEDEIMHSRTTSFIQRKLFRKWKETNSDRVDRGIPLLLGALFKGGCRNVANTVQIQLKQWYERWQDNGEAFTEWVNEAYHNSDLLVPSDYPKPMTDAYLVLMSDELPPSKHLAHSLLIGETEAADILNSPAYLLDGIRVMKILTMFRDRTQRTIDALETLIFCLEDLGFQKLRNYAVMCAKAWLKRTATRRDDPFRYHVDQLMNKLE